MLYITFFDNENKAIWDIGSFFNFNYEDEWFDDPLVRQMVLDVDKTEIVSSQCAISPVLGQIPITKLSGGVKNLIMMLKEPGYLFRGSSCGDNCAKWIVEISKMHDIHMSLEHLMHFDMDFDAVCVDNGHEIHSNKDYVEEAIYAISSYFN